MTLRDKASLLIALIIAGVLAITGIYHIRFFEASLRNSVLEGLETVNNASGQVISRFLSDTLMEVEAIAMALPRKAVEERDVPAIEHGLKVFSEKFSKFENGMFLLDENGILWSDYPVHPEVRGKSFAFREYFQKTVEEGRGIIGSPYRSARTGKPVLTFTALLRDSSNRVMGVLGCSVQLTSPNALEGTRLTRIGKNGYIYVYGMDRLMILHPDEERILMRDVPPGANKLFDAAIEGFEGSGETVNSRGVRMLVSLKRIPGTNWILGAQQPASEAFAPLEEAGHRILRSILFSVSIAVLFAAIVMTGITRPLSKFRNAVMLLGSAGETSGDLAERKTAHWQELEGIRQGGEIGDLIKAFLGISEQLERTMRSLKSSARDWERTFDSVSDAIVILDTDGRIVRVNHAARSILKTEHSEAIGKPVADFLSKAKIRDGSYSDKGKSAQDGLFFVEMERDASRRVFEVSMTPLMEDLDKRVGTVLVAKEITSKVQVEEDKKRLEAQLQQAQKMEAIGTLAGGIAHNFNNLLMGIQGNASLVLLDSNPDQSHYRRAKNIEKLVQSGSRLTTQLLGYAREGKFRMHPLSLNHLIRETGETFAMARKDIRVQQDLREDLPSIMADQGQIEQVLMNLFVNAADAMPNGGVLFLKTTRFIHTEISGKPYEVKPGEYVLLEVRDTGTGMDRKTLERIFDPFFTTKGLGKGTGLGLASVYGIIKGHDGYIDVESEPGKGTGFQMYLPACGQEPVRRAIPSSRLTQGHERVLLVDDEEMILDIGHQILSSMGYSVSVARSGKEAIELYSKERDSIDLVLLDMIMPDMCGGETFDHLKQINPGVKVLLSSGYSIDGQAGEILRRGCNGFIQKPFNIEQLSQKIRDILICAPGVGHS